MGFIGLDIGARSLKAAQLEKRPNGKFDLLTLGISVIKSKGYYSDSESDLASFANEIKTFWKENGFGTRDVAIALPEDQTYSRFLTMPKVSGDELESALRWEAEQYVPISLEEAVVSHQIVDEVDDGSSKKIQVFLVAAPKRLVEKITNVLKVAGLNLYSVETEMISLSRCFAGSVKGSAVIVDFGLKTTDLAIIKNGQLLFTKSTPTGGDAFTRAVEVAFGIPNQQAEEYKKVYGFDQSKASGKVFQVLSPMGAIIIDEIRKMLEYYRQEIDAKNPVSQVILTGGGSLLPEIVGYIASGIGVEVQRGDPFLPIDDRDKFVDKIKPENRYMFGVSVGLAMKDL